MFSFDLGIACLAHYCCPCAGLGLTPSERFVPSIMMSAYGPVAHCFEVDVTALVSCNFFILLFKDTADKVFTLRFGNSWGDSETPSTLSSDSPPSSVSMATVQHSFFLSEARGTVLGESMYPPAVTRSQEVLGHVCLRVHLPRMAWLYSPM